MPAVGCSFLTDPPELFATAALVPLSVGFLLMVFPLGVFVLYYNAFSVLCAELD